MFSQRTLGESVAAVGIGLHSGRKIRLVLRPAPADTGIVFRRVDLEPPVDIPAEPLNVNDTRMATTVNVGRAAVATIEHLMSAFSGLGVDNCIVEVNAPEIPVMDGSGASFVYLLHSAGIVEQNAARKFVRILKPIEVREGDLLHGTEGKADVIIANIIADIVIMLLQDIPQKLNDNGVLLASGIIEERMPDVEAAAQAQGLYVDAVDHRGGWVVMPMKKKK